MPPCSVQVDDNSAETNPAGIRNTIAEKIKKKTNEGPNKAVAGRFRMLSIDPVISITNKNKPRLRTEFFINHIPEDKLYKEPGILQETS